MKQRIITAIIALCVMMPFVIFSDTFLLLIFSAVLAGVGVGELLHCTGLLRRLAVSIPSVLIAAFASCLPRICKSGEQCMIILFIVYFMYMIFMLTTAVFSHGSISVIDSALSALMTIYVSFGFSALVLLRDMENGLFLFLLAIIAPWICDAFAYFTGMLFGRHKLIPDVSPKKTIEGAVGGTLCGVIITVVYGMVITKCFDADIATIPVYIVIGLLMCIVSQCGDLIASLIKRHYGIKDYGKVFPGHGGVLDRFDSIIPNSALLFFVMTVIAGLSQF